MENVLLEKLSGMIDISILQQIKDALIETFSKDREHIARIAVIGQSGVGKTSTINALFNTNLPVSHTGSCTQTSHVVRTTTDKGIIEVIDMPGLWAGEQESLRHWETYRKELPTVDCAIWIISAGDRALEGMQNALEIISKFSDADMVNRIVFAINKAEHMYPEDWNNDVNLPSTEQEKYLEEFCITVKEAILEKFPKWDGSIKYYSARKHFRLGELLEAMLRNADSDNRIKVYRVASPKTYEEKVSDMRACDLAKEMLRRGE